MDATSQIYVVLALQVVHLLERLFYWIFMWSMTIKRSKCVTSICSGCLKIKGEVDEDSEEERQQSIKLADGTESKVSGQ